MRRLVEKLLACWLMLVLMMGAAGGAEDPDPYGIQVLANQVSFPGVKIQWSWEDCGMTNAFYFPSEDRIVLCNEMKVYPAGVVRYAFLHEAGHAVIDQLNLPIVGNGELAADSFAAWIFGITRRYADLESAVDLWWSLKDVPETPWDEHPAPARRAHTLRCLLSGAKSTGHYGNCIQEWRHTVWAWNRLLRVG